MRSIGHPHTACAPCSGVTQGGPSAEGAVSQRRLVHRSDPRDGLVIMSPHLRSSFIDATAPGSLRRDFTARADSTERTRKVTLGRARVGGTLIREMCSEAVVEAVGLEKNDWTRHLLGPMRLIPNLADEAQDQSSFAAKISAALSRKLIEGLHASERGGNRVTFRIPQSLDDAWGISGSDAKAR